MDESVNEPLLYYENRIATGMSIGDGAITDSSAYQIVQNTEIDGVNKSNYCVKIDYKSTFTAWGLGGSFGINNSTFIKFIEESTE